MVYHYNYFRIIYRLSDDKPEHIEAQMKLHVFCSGVTLCLD